MSGDLISGAADAVFLLAFWAGAIYVLIAVVRRIRKNKK